MPRVGGHPGSGLDTCKSSFCDSSTTNGDISLLSAEASREMSRGSSFSVAASMDTMAYKGEILLDVAFSSFSCCWDKIP